jgi:hypothetical protein
VRAEMCPRLSAKSCRAPRAIRNSGSPNTCSANVNIPVAMEASQRHA